MPEEKTVSILNLSKFGRKYQVTLGYEQTKDKEGNVVTLPVQGEILPNQIPVEVPEKEAAFLLGKRKDGQKRFPDLIDAAQFVPASKQQKDALLENEKLRKENEELKAKLDAANKPSIEENDEDKPKGGKKK